MTLQSECTLDELLAEIWRRMPSQQFTARSPVDRDERENAGTRVSRSLIEPGTS